MKQHSVCRCCLSKGSHLDMYKKYNINGQLIVVWDVLIECFSLYLAEGMHLSTKICKVCITQLQNAQKFRKLVLDSEKQLLAARGGVETETEFVNVLDPLLDCGVKTEIKLESQEEISEDERYNEDDHQTDIEDLVLGERELLQRFSSLTALPTRQTLRNTCPVYVTHLEAMKGQIIDAASIQTAHFPESYDNNTIEQIKIPNHYKHRRKMKTTRIVLSEKMAYALNATAILEFSNAVPFKSKMRCGFPCFYCRKIFSNLELVRDHQSLHPKHLLFKLLSKYTADSLVVYADITNLKCTICNDDINTIEQLKEHLVNEHNKRIYKGFSDRVICFKLEDKESNFDCHICGANFETFGAIDRHMNLHYNHFVCDECGAGFITKHRLKVHHYMLHRDVKICCEKCKKVFASKHKYRTHNENVHKKSKKARCVICSEGFIDYFTRQKHMVEKHGTEPILYKCSKCDKSFNRKYSLTIHFKRLHLQNRDVQCDLCPFMCYTKSELRSHMFKHGAEKSFKCSVCRKAFMRKKTLTVHMRVHNDDRRYSCHLCGETFVHNWSLKSHLKTHSVEGSD